MPGSVVMMPQETRLDKVWVTSLDGIMIKYLFHFKNNEISIAFSL